MTNPAALTIRAKKLGVLIRDARLAFGKSLAECAQALGVDQETFEQYEWGAKSPSLPELEVLAYLLNVPLGRFWGDKTLAAGNLRKGLERPEKVVALRQRIVGATLRKARQEAGISLEALAELVVSSPRLLESYEMGEAPVPIPDLEALSAALGRPLADFQDRQGPLGAWATQQRAMEGFLSLPAELQAFISKPVNRPYLMVAQRLSEMSAEKLRAIAEGLLEITY